MSNTAEQNLAINTIRFLSADGVQKANSGHPGLPMGTAAMAFTIWTKHLIHHPGKPAWANRDRFVLSGGHGSMLLYSLLYLSGYDVKMEDLKQFRQWGSITPGHPEFGVTPGVETTTGPLGQGFANGIGMAIAEARLAAEFNRPGYTLIDHHIYAIVTDGDLMEGVASEAASLAGHLKLGKCIYLYDDNRISIEGSTDLAFTEDRGARFEAYGWQVLHVADGNDVDQIDRAIREAKADPRPSLIICRTTIGYGLPTRAGTAKAHGEPPGQEELDGAKKSLGWPLEPAFHVPEDALKVFHGAVTHGEEEEKAWLKQFDRYQVEFPELAAELKRRLDGKLPSGWEKSLPAFPTDAKGMASRVASGKTINALGGVLPELMGGSADLAPSNNTWIQDSAAFSAEDHNGRNIHFGVREHGMGSIINGMAYHGGLLPFGATFLVFTDYLRPAIRLAALSHLKTIWVMTHDSVGLGEDGPTHQPVEHLAALRSIPNVHVIRPGDANETAEAWRAAASREKGPTVLALSRQAMPTIDRDEFAPASGLLKGAYVLKDFGQGKIDLILMASGSELNLIIETAKLLEKDGVNARVVSFPCWELFAQQDEAYRESVLPKAVKARVSVEAGITMGWEKWTGPGGLQIGIDHYGYSAPANVIFEKIGFTPAAIAARARGLIG